MLNTYLGMKQIQIKLLAPTIEMPFAVLESQTNCLLTIGQKDIALQAGDITLIRTEQPIQLAPASNLPFKVRLFQVPIARDVEVGSNQLIEMMLLTDDDTHIVFRRIDHDLVNNYCDQLAHLIKANPQDSILKYEQQMIVRLLLTELSRWRLNAMMVIESNFSERETHHIPKAHQTAIILNYIRNNLATVTLNSTATHFGYEPNYFSRLCHQLFQRPFSHEVQFIKTNQAKKLLQLSDQNITDIAYTLGYSNVANFDRQFKKYAGMSPSEFRRQQH
ncbi:helix-turn-helix transcriptional regulator [Lapidilactobacillus bayanensis]|uniref:helix-turn-helix transcriptional regulator n=1 Tax=Lapidilactobacillus bayanensis TaxID=2485998 RepID=UPI000F796F29|nr:AraC family transcriptional regulator [Lapidilactobacillus bayanensis]